MNFKDYEKLDYIETDNNLYIDTGVTCNNFTTYTYIPTNDEKIAKTLISFVSIKNTKTNEYIMRRAYKGNALGFYYFNYQDKNGFYYIDKVTLNIVKECPNDPFTIGDLTAYYSFNPSGWYNAESL